MTIFEVEIRPLNSAADLTFTGEAMIYARSNSGIGQSVDTVLKSEIEGETDTTRLTPARSHLGLRPELSLIDRRDVCRARCQPFQNLW